MRWLTFHRHANRSFDSNHSDDEGAPLRRYESEDNKMSSNSLNQGQKTDGHHKLPADPWVLQVRWRKDGMYPPGTIPPGSTHSSQIDLRRQSLASLSSTTGSTMSRDTAVQDPDSGVVMHLDIQLYEMEPGVYLVDFKCAGYETPDGVMLEEKDVTSPFPFLDLASTLIIQLAEAD